MNDIGIILRFWHNDRSEQEWRLDYFETAVLPRLKAQTYKDFDICPLSPEQDHPRLKAMDDRIKPFTLNEPYDYSIHSNFKYGQTVGLRRYPIQIRIDSDDLVQPDFMQKILDADTDYVTFQPELYILRTGEIKKMRHRYRANKPSMFLAVKNYPECVYHRVFFRFNERPGTIYPEGCVYMTIHDTNFGTTENS